MVIKVITPVDGIPTVKVHNVQISKFAQHSEQLQQNPQHIPVSENINVNVAITVGIPTKNRFQNMKNAVPFVVVNWNTSSKLRPVVEKYNTSPTAFIPTSRKNMNPKITSCEYIGLGFGAPDTLTNIFCCF